MSANGTCRVFRADPASLDQREIHHCATFSARHVPPSTVVVAVQGEVDASNSRALARYIEGQIAGSSRLVLDLRPADFFGAAGFAALHNVNVISSQYGVTWMMRAGRQVRRLLAICDPDGTFRWRRRSQPSMTGTPPRRSRAPRRRGPVRASR